MEQSSTNLQRLLKDSELTRGRNSAGEEIDRGTQLESSPLPVPLAGEEDITSRWLTLALQGTHSVLPAVEQVTVLPFSESDFDITVRLQCQLAAENEGPLQLLCKISKPLPAPQWGEFIAAVCDREAAAYRELHHHNACRIPKLYYAVHDKQRYTLLVEDHDALPAKSSLTTIDEQIDAVLRELALLHGCFARHSPVSAPAWLLRPRDFGGLIGQRYVAGLACLKGDQASLLLDEHQQLLEDFSHFVVAWHRYEKHVLTITHGDVRNDNMLYQRKGMECRASLIGWKLAGLRNPMFDVASLISNSLTTAERRLSERRLLERYRRQFEQSGIHYAVTDAHHDYRFHLFAPLIFNVCAAAFLGETARQNESLMKNIARNCQAVLDWDAMQSLRRQLPSNL